MEAWRKDLEARARALGLTGAEARNPGYLTSWPRLEQLKTSKDLHGRPWLAGTRLEVVAALSVDSYGRDSRIAHLKDPALRLAMRQTKPFTQQELESIRNVSMLRALTFHAAFLTELEHGLAGARSARRDLQKAWDVLVPAFDPAAEVHGIRYRDLLA